MLCQTNKFQHEGVSPMLHELNLTQSTNQQVMQLGCITYRDAHFEEAASPRVLLNVDYEVAGRGALHPPVPHVNSAPQHWCHLHIITSSNQPFCRLFARESTLDTSVQFSTGVLATELCCVACTCKSAVTVRKTLTHHLA